MSKTKTLNLSRRSFLKVSAMAAAAAAVASTVVPKAYGDVRTVNPGDLVKADGDTKVVRTACRGCGKFECGVFVTVVNGRAVKVVGDDSYSGSMGNCCAKSQASLQAAYHPARLKYPMMRTNPKGENPGWKRITWDEALATIDEKMSEIEEKYGPSANCFFGGTSRIYAMGFSALQTLYNSQMSITPGQVCKGPRTTLTRNTSIAEMNFCENSWRPNLWIQWGSGIEVSNYDDAGRVAVDNASHADCYINIDARMSNLAKEASSRPGSFFMAPRPATDGAIALCWIKMIIDRELYDSWYVKRWTDCAFLVAEEMGPTPLSVSSGAGLQGTAGSGATAAKGDTVLLKESDVDPAMLPWTVEGDGDPKRFIVWDAANDRFTYLDSTTGLWEGERPFKMGYVAGSEWYMQAAKWNKFFEEQPESLWEKYEWEEVKGNYVVSARDDLTAFLPDQDAMPTVEGMEYATDPSLYSSDIPEIKLKDGRTIKVETVFERLYANAEEWTPAKAAETTGIKEELFTEVFDAAFAKRYDPLSGVYQGSINYAVTHEHTGNAMKVLQCIEVLDILRGVMDTPGGHRSATKAASVNVDQSTNIIGQYLRTGDAKADPSRQMKYYDSTHLAMKGDADATACFHSIANGIPFQTHGAMAEAGQVLNQSNILEAYEAMKNLDFFCDANLWEDPISSLADILLPEQHWMEIPFATRCTQGSNGFYGAHINCIKPLGETRFGNDWICELYKVHGTPFWNRTDGGDPWEWEDYLMNRAVQSTGMTWQEFVAEFLENGWIDARKANPNGWGCYRRFQTGWMNLGKPGYNTNTTRHEVWCINLETKMRHNVEQCTGQEYGTKYALPYYTEPKSSPNGGGGYVQVQGNNPDNPNAEKIKGYTFDKYPFILSTGRRIPVYFHSEHRQLPWCREVWPVPRLEVNPADAEKLGLAQGDWAWIETPFGKIRQCVEIAPNVGEGRMNAEHSWWFPELDQPGHGFELCGCNCLVDSWSQCEGYGAPQLRGYLANVYKATPENSPFGNPVPCGVDGTEIITSASDPRLKAWERTYEGRD
ncbi:molybdopterin dinucleotide binding domain-containing protein [Parvibacter caecicola]|uniref:molybdopterin dinucleotide binding domain-containing protein n=1 Tax=Parvibacter caecicola TaxID=747645 RepID=UPI00249A8139|nr:molybdopterin dinucleotide binding domain-containing protein [Parvibacter caecicola]